VQNQSRRPSPSQTQGQCLKDPRRLYYLLPVVVAMAAAVAVTAVAAVAAAAVVAVQAAVHPQPDCGLKRV